MPWNVIGSAFNVAKGFCLAPTGKVAPGTVFSAGVLAPVFAATGDPRAAAL